MGGLEDNFPMDQRGDFSDFHVRFRGVSRVELVGFAAIPAKVPVKPPMAPPPQPPANNMVWFMGKEWSCFWVKDGGISKREDKKVVWNVMGKQLRSRIFFEFLKQQFYFEKLPRFF